MEDGGQETEGTAVEVALVDVAEETFAAQLAAEGGDSSDGVITVVVVELVVFELVGLIVAQEVVVDDGE